MKLITELNHDLLVDRVYNELKKAIIYRVFEPGHKLDIYDLAAKFKVSRTPIKEAFNRLQIEGLIYIKPRIGTFVADLNFSEFEEIFEARLMIETWAIQIGIHVFKDSDIVQLQQYCDKMSEILLDEDFDYMKFNEFDALFHKKIVDMSGNYKIIKMYEQLNPHWNTARVYYPVAKQKTQHHSHHIDIIKYFREKNEKELSKVIKEHIKAGKSGLKELFTL